MCKKDWNTQIHYDYNCCNEQIRKEFSNASNANTMVSNYTLESKFAHRGATKPILKKYYILSNVSTGITYKSIFILFIYSMLYIKRNVKNQWKDWNIGKHSFCGKNSRFLYTFIYTFM